MEKTKCFSYNFKNLEVTKNWGKILNDAVQNIKLGKKYFSSKIWYQQALGQQSLWIKKINTVGKTPVHHPRFLLQNLSPHSSFLTVIHVQRRRYIFSFVGHFHQTTMLFSRSGTVWRNNSCPRNTRFFWGKIL